MKTTAAQFKALLPTLAHLARFPRCNRQAIARADGVDLAEVEAIMGEFAGAPAFWDEERASAAAKKFGLTLPPVRALVKAAPAPTAVRAVPAKVEFFVAAPPGADLREWLVGQGVKPAATSTVFQVEVSPALAKAWLRFNRGNRNPSAAKVRRFAAAMKANKWHLNGESVKFCATGRLLDGQSRLMAICAAGVPVLLEVRGGLPDLAQATMDSGEVRRGAHMLEMLGERYPTITAPALRLIFQHEEGTLAGNKFGRKSGVLENLEIAPLLARHAGLKASVGWVVSTGHKITHLMAASEAAFFHHLFGLANPKRRDEFFAALADGLGLTRDSAAYHLRERLIAERSASAKIAKRDRLALVIKAWNLFHARAKVNQLKFRAEGEAAEQFPAVAGLPEKNEAA